MIKKYKLQIELKSDLCASSGEAFGTFVDTDVCYDEYGLPFIPSKRIKGILRENAYEFLGWQDKVKKDDLDNLFGIPGNFESGKLRINNAYIDNYEIIYDNLDNISEEDKKYLSRQRMINLFTYVRAQTAIDDETGTSKENSLRAIRAVKRDNKLYSIIEIEYQDNIEEIENYLKNIVKTVTHIGMNRTRGFGEIKCNLFDEIEVLNEENLEDLSIVPNDCNTLKLLFKADSDIIVAKQNREVSESYISGSNILGNIAKKYISKNGKEITDEYINLFLNGNVKYSNGYISNKSCLEFYPVPFSYVKVKNTSDKFHNKIYNVEETGIQLSSLTGKFVTFDKNNYITDVKMNENLHHQRPEDKSIGHATENEGSYYQFVAIKKGQYFWAKIVGENQNLNKIKELINKNDIFYVGKSRTAEYGKLILEDISFENRNQETKEYDHFAVLLTSDAIVLDNNTSLASNNKEILVQNIKKILSIEDEIIDKEKSVREFVNYGKASGYNILWNLPKEQQETFLAGSILEFKLKEKINLKDEYYIGQRQVEGYGNIKIIDLNENSSKLNLLKYEEKNESRKLTTEEFKNSKELKELKKLYIKSVQNMIYEEIIKYIQNEVKNKLVSLNNATIGRVLLMLKQSENSEEFIKNINGIKDDKKLDKVKRVIENFEIEMFESVKKYRELSSNNFTPETIEKYKMFYYKNCFEMLKVEGGKK